MEEASWTKEAIWFKLSLNVPCCMLWFTLFGNIVYNASVSKQKKRKCISSLQKCNDLNFLFNNCKDAKALMLVFNNEFINLFVIDVHKILSSAFSCIDTDSYFKAAIKKLPLMEVMLLAIMRIECGFDQDPSMNSINFKIIWRFFQRPWWWWWRT